MDLRETINTYMITDLCSCSGFEIRRVWPIPRRLGERSKGDFLMILCLVSLISIHIACSYLFRVCIM